MYPVFGLVACLVILFGTWNPKFYFRFSSLVYGVLACTVQCFVWFVFVFVFSILLQSHSNVLLCVLKSVEISWSINADYFEVSGNFLSGICVSICVFACLLRQTKCEYLVNCISNLPYNKYVIFHTFNFWFSSYFTSVRSHQHFILFLFT
jgi:hypothetical protein